MRRTALAAVGVLGVIVAPRPPVRAEPTASIGQSAQALTIGPNVQVSASLPATMHGEGMIVADPTDATRLVVCAMSIDAHRGHGVVTYASADGGARWARTYETPPDGVAGDPACAFGPDGTAYLTMMPMTVSSMSKMRLPLLRSRDGGWTWQPAGGVTGGLDRESIVVDGTGGRFHNRIYVHGTAGIHGPNGLMRSTVALYASADGGRTFGRRAEWAALGGGYLAGAANAVVLSDGRWLTLLIELKNFFETPVSMAVIRPVYSPPPEPEDVSLKAISSDDGGETLNNPVTVSGVHMPNSYVRWSETVPAIAADTTGGPFRDRIYAAWGDSRFGGTDILLSYSADRGQTWSAPIVVN
ncbi:MAG TPA: sialidase family protein, partial [Gemmatimonadaceae bacterium]